MSPGEDWSTGGPAAWIVEVQVSVSRWSGDLGQAGEVTSVCLDGAAGQAVASVTLSQDASVHRGPSARTQDRKNVQARDGDGSRKEQPRQHQAPSAPACSCSCVWMHTHETNLSSIHRRVLVLQPLLQLVLTCFRPELRFPVVVSPLHTVGPRPPYRV